MRRVTPFARLLFFSVLTLGAVSIVAVSQTPQAPVGVFTANQAASGRALYAQACAACHGADMEGSGDAPALSGGTFTLNWRSKMISELFGQILQTMPLNSPGSLDEAAALNVTAYILERN